MNPVKARKLRKQEAIATRKKKNSSNVFSFFSLWARLTPREGANMMITAMILFASFAFGRDSVILESPKLSGYPILALTPLERVRSPEEQVEMAYTRGSNLCNFLGLPKGEYRERWAATVSLGLQRPADPVSLLAMTSQGQWKVLIATFPGTDFTANFSRIVCEGLK